MRLRESFTVLLLFVAGGSRLPAADLVEFLNGARAEGTVVAIHKDKKEIEFEVELSGRRLKRTYPYSKIMAVTYQGKRYVLNAAAPAQDATARAVRSPAVIEQLIAEAGQTPPDWLASVPLQFPRTLDLSWPETPPDKAWNNQKNMGQYIWDIINPNPSKWREGVKLLHHLLELHPEDASRRQRIMNELGRMYHNLLEDYPRAAYWWRRAGVEKVRETPFRRSTVLLAECYWRMGNKGMAHKLLQEVPPNIDVVKLLGDFGDLAGATRLADLLAPAYLKADFSATDVYLTAGHACRMAGDYPRALAYYRKVMDEPKMPKGHGDRNKRLAQAALDAIRLYELTDVTKVADGSYEDSSLGYEGPVRVRVVVAGKRLESVEVVQHKEKQFYSAMSDTPAKILARQGVKGVDATSSATITSQAIINATAKALAQGMKAE